jgi:hypothetical protein
MLSLSPAVFVFVDLARVDRPQPEAPTGDFEQGAEASNAIDAGLGVQAHGKGTPARALAALSTVDDGGLGGRIGRRQKSLARWFRKGQEKRGPGFLWPRRRCLRHGAVSFVGQGLPHCAGSSKPRVFRGCHISVAYFKTVLSARRLRPPLAMRRAARCARPSSKTRPLFV